eukprot:8072903-Alexandrium_andersonii.AAC.1
MATRDLQSSMTALQNPSFESRFDDVMQRLFPSVSAADDETEGVLSAHIAHQLDSHAVPAVPAADGADAAPLQQPTLQVGGSPRADSADVCAVHEAWASGYSDGLSILQEYENQVGQGPVSYTHLTLPTICSV